MALGTVGSGTHTCVLDTPADLQSTTFAGVYVCQYNFLNAVKGDIFRCFATAKVLTGDTETIVWQGYVANDQVASELWYSSPITSMFSMSMMIEQTDGTGRNVPWSLVRIAEY
jgi:hypothetical protein